jgi:tetraacyldisaccharide 4'-kinase
MNPDRFWYEPHPVRMLLLPLVLLFYVLSSIRRWLYKTGVLEIKKFPVPLIVVGNITVGGTGKTPLVIWLAQHLRSLGYKPGIVCRGYGGKAAHWPQQVSDNSDPAMLGDEAVLLAMRTGCSVWVGPDRPAAVHALLNETLCDLVLSDDGLQHYAMDRDLEILVIDGQRGFGNGYLLPAGPLREPVSRLRTVDLVISNGAWRKDIPQMQMVQPRLVPLQNPLQESKSLNWFEGRQVHALAGIGHPEKFFKMLEQHGMKPVRHAFSDHHEFVSEELQFRPGLPILMTEKDGVKCKSLLHGDSWVVRIDAQPDNDFIKQLNILLQELDHG